MVASGGRAWGHLLPPSWRLCPPSQKKKMAKISHFWISAPSELHFSPWIPPQKNFLVSLLSKVAYYFVWLRPDDRPVSQYSRKRNNYSPGINLTTHCYSLLLCYSGCYAVKHHERRLRQIPALYKLPGNNIIITQTWIIRLLFCKFILPGQNDE